MTEKTQNQEKIKLQALVDATLYNRCKMIAAQKGWTIPDLIEDMMENYVEAEEEKWLDKIFAERLEQAHAGGKLDEMPNVKRYYEELSKNKN